MKPQHYWLALFAGCSIWSAYWHVIMLGQMWADQPYQDARNTGTIWLAVGLVGLGKHLESRKSGS